MEKNNENNLEMIENYSGNLQYQSDRNEFEAHCLWWMARLLGENEIVEMIKTFDRLRHPAVREFTNN